VLTTVSELRRLVCVPPSGRLQPLFNHHRLLGPIGCMPLLLLPEADEPQARRRWTTAAFAAGFLCFTPPSLCAADRAALQALQPEARPPPAALGFG
jgi:hypothetical protein